MNAKNSIPKHEIQTCLKHCCSSFLPNDERRPDGCLHRKERSRKKIQQRAHLDTFNPNATTSQDRNSSESLQSNMDNPVGHQDLSRGINHTLKDEDCGRPPFAGYVDKVVMVEDNAMKPKPLDYWQQVKDSEGSDVLDVSEENQDSDASSDMEDPKDVDYTPRDLVEDTCTGKSLKRKPKPKPTRSSKKKILRSSIRKTKAVGKIKAAKAKVKSEPKGRYFCKECKKNFKNPYSFKMHNHKVHGATQPEKEKLCTQCGKVFGCTSTLKTHQREVHSEVVIRIPCPVCNNQVRKFDFNRHMHMSHSGLKFLCDLCGAELKSQKGLRAHKRDVHLIPELQGWKAGDVPPTGPFACDICGKVLKNMRKLIGHKKVIHNPASHYCQWLGCEKVFKDKQNLKTHMLLHTGEMPIKCNLCDYRCRQHSSLHYHMRSKHNHKTGSSTSTTRAEMVGKDVSKDVSKMGTSSDLPRTEPAPLIVQPVNYSSEFYYPAQAAPQWPTATRYYTM